MHLGDLYFGEKSLRNSLVYQGLGGRGGGSIYLNSRHMDVDGRITLQGEDAHVQHGQNAGKFVLYICGYHK